MRARALDPKLESIRKEAGLTQAALAERVGISRQAYLAIESGKAVPSVAIALSLAEVLLQPVEALFGAPGRAARLAEGEGAVVMGCAPALSLLRTWWVNASSRDALVALGQQRVNVAGVHATSFTEIAAIISKPVVVALTRWRAGFAVARDNPKGIHEAADLAQRRLRIAARGQGTGARRWLEAAIAGAGLMPEHVLARAWNAPGHVEAAQAVALGTADVGITIEPVARASGCDFVPLVDERFDLVVDASADDPRASRVLDTITTKAFAKDLDALGYDASCAGQRISA